VPRKRLKSLVTAAGITVSPNGSFDSAQLVGCKLNADVVHETYQSKPDPITGQSTEKISIRIVNERSFGGINASSTVSAGRPVSAPSVGGSLPGLTKA
jgi:hypothetical protein